jgi:hypothetical protein
MFAVQLFQNNVCYAYATCKMQTSVMQNKCLPWLTGACLCCRSINFVIVLTIIG